MEDDTERDQTARSSVDVDTIWKTRQSTIWDMRHDPEGGEAGWDFSNFEDRNRARRKMGRIWVSCGKAFTERPPFFLT